MVYLMVMDVQTNYMLEADAYNGAGEPCGRVRIPTGAIILDMEFEPADPSVGIFQGTAIGYYDGMLVDFGGVHWDWWGEPITEPGGSPVTGWFTPMTIPDWRKREKMVIAAGEVQ